jgi:FtsP/CotA-like multicopper oxidase with cupredoxin domain
LVQASVQDLGKSTMRQSLEDETHELSEKSSLDIESSAAEDDQGQRLLDETTSSHEDGTSSQARVKSRKVAFIWWTICLAATAVCLATALWNLMRNTEPRGDQVARPEITTNDYVLDPKWDHDASPQRREYKFTIRDHMHNPDGIYRPMILVNNQYPGPLIEANEGDTIVVHVDNQATNATAIHWHGIYQIGTPHMDGTVGVTQCPIGPGRSFTYEFTVTGQSGTYWWHGHQGLQSSDGLHGPLVIHVREERTLQQMPYDTDRVVLLSDHYHDLSSVLLWQYLMPDMENAEPVPESGLINGKNIRNCDDYPGRQCDNTTANVGRAKILLDRNKNHRLRFINVGAFAEFSVQLDEHELTVTEVDGTDVLPVKYHRLNISPAQRYSVVISSNVTSADAF